MFFLVESRRHHHAGRVMRFIALLAIAGCTTVPGAFEEHLAAPAEDEQACARWYEALDRAIDEAGVRDAQYARVAGFPYLRADRFIASVREQAAAADGAMRAFADQLLELDLEARAFEIENLPSWDGSRKAALAHTAECGRTLLALDLARPASRQAMRDHASVPDDYSTTARAFGLYPLTSLFFARGVRQWEAETRQRLSQPVGERPGVVRFAPPATARLSRSAVAGMLARARFDPLGRPLLTEREVELLAAVYAPSFEVAVAADYDRFGELRWRRGGVTPEVDAAEPAVYVRHAYARYGERVLLQLVYTLWFPERPKDGTFDLLAGRLDGLVWRVTLAPDGEPLVYDSIHPCGCYHQFFPTPRARVKPAPDTGEEWAFVPVALPRVDDGQRPVVSIESGTHYLGGVAFVHGIDSVVRYSFHPYDELRSMMRLDGGRRSAFGADGLVAGTERMERFFFWPMGIASAGAMRQWGRQASAFVGRRHFDDADLLERRFDIELVQ